MRSSLHQPDPGQTWFVAFPDCDAAHGAPAALGRYAPQMLPHASGRPWLLGCWGAKELVTAQARHVRVAVIGCCPVTAAALSASAHQVRTAADLDQYQERYATEEAAQAGHDRAIAALAALLGADAMADIAGPLVPGSSDSDWDGSLPEA